MIKDNQQHFNRLHVIIDAFVIVVSYWTHRVVHCHLDFT